MLTVDDLLGKAERLGIDVLEAALPHPYFGYYDDDRRAITIGHDLRPWQLRCALCHELIHAIHRDTGCATMQGMRAERRARRETALRLIDPLEYASAEGMYEGGSYLIACELDVKRQVIDDYQMFVLDEGRYAWSV